MLDETQIGELEHELSAEGVALDDPVKAYLKEKANSIQVLPVANLSKKNIAMLRAYGKSGKAPAKFLEVMACEGGCITGPCVHNELRAGKRKFEKELGKETKTYEDMD